MAWWEVVCSKWPGTTAATCGSWQKVGGGSKPYLADPRPQEADAHFAVVVEVGVEPPAALREVAEERRDGRVDVGELDVEEEEAVFVGRARGSFDKC